MHKLSIIAAVIYLGIVYWQDGRNELVGEVAAENCESARTSSESSSGLREQADRMQEVVRELAGLIGHDVDQAERPA